MRLSFAAALTAPVLLAAAAILVAGEPAPPVCPHCGPAAGCRYCEVVEHVCRAVREKKPIKKAVYEMKEVPHCLHKPTCPGHCEADCPQCRACPRYKRVLVKREIECGYQWETKCVVEEVRRLVPCCSRCQARLGPAVSGELLVDAPPDGALPEAAPGAPRTAAAPVVQEILPPR